MKPKKGNKEALRVIFLNSHPIQYYAPLYQYMDSRKDVDLTVVYCSKHGLEGELDVGFGVPVKWDIPLLGGYKSVFLKNYAFRPHVYGMWGLINLGIVPFLFKSPKSILVVYGWGYFTNLLALFFGRLFGHIVCMRGDNPASHERLKNEKSVRRKKFFLNIFQFRLIDYFLCVGKENCAYFKLYGAPERKLVFTPHAVDNERFSQSYQKLIPRKDDIKTSLGIPSEHKVILYSGKYIDKKRPLDLLLAYQQSGISGRVSLVFMGEGELRSEMEQFIQENGLENIYLTGFVNQSKVAEYYIIADVLVMCSQTGETWGLSVNEAMNFRLPLILSDLTGCAPDLLKEGENGYLFKAKDVEALAKLLEKMFELPEAKRIKMGEASARIITRYSYAEIVKSIRKIWQKTTA